MPLIKVYNNDSDPYGLKGHSIFKSVRPFIFGYVAIPKLHEWYLRRYVRAASAEAASFCRTFGDKAWSQQTQMNTNVTLSSHYLIWSDSGLGRGFDLFGVSRIECYSSCNVLEVENLDAIECGVVGLFITPTTKNGRWKCAVA